VTRYAGGLRPTLTGASGALMHAHVGSEANVAFRPTKANDRLSEADRSPLSPIAFVEDRIGTINPGHDPEKIVVGKSRQ
jgi:hypothetical protein